MGHYCFTHIIDTAMSWGLEDLLFTSSWFPWVYGFSEGRVASGNLQLVIENHNFR